MKEFNEAVVVLAKCAEGHKTYGIRTEKTGSHRWRLTWAFPIKESSAKREGYDKTSIGGQFEHAPEYPGCPYCGQRNFTVCTCGHVNCTILRNGVFTCEWCGRTGTIEDYSGQAIKAGDDL